MKKMINIAKLLKDCPKGTKLYSPLFGEVTFKYINDSEYGIIVADSERNYRSFDKYGRFFTKFNNAECLLFPAKGQSWEEWEVCTCKFKVLDWIVRNNGSSDVPIQVYGVKKDKYLVINMLGSKGELMINKQDEWHLWSIQDAKYGDILLDEDTNTIGIFKKIYENYWHSKIYCGNSTSLVVFDSGGAHKIKAAKPATKEQCDMLFSKMREAGYEWDADKKEVHKIKSHYDIANFKVGMPVLERSGNDEHWDYNIFSRYLNNNCSHPFILVGCHSRQCIPFEGNEHLLGTTDMCDECYINW